MYGEEIKAPRTRSGLDSGCPISEGKIEAVVQDPTYLIACTSLLYAPIPTIYRAASFQIAEQHDRLAMVQAL